MTTLLVKRLSADLTLAEGERSIIATITTESLDRDNEVLIAGGMDTKEYMRNPVVLWNHDRSLPPIGKATAITREGDTWRAKAVFAQGVPLAEEIHSLVKQGILRGVSVGFVPVEHREPTKRDREKYGDAVRRVFNKWRLMEWSIVPIGSNPDALVNAVAKGAVTAERCKALGLNVPEQPRRVLMLGEAPSPRRVLMVEEPVADISAIVRREVAKRMGRMFA